MFYYLSYCILFFLFLLFLSLSRFTNNIVLTNSTHEKLTEILKELKEAFQTNGLTVNVIKTRVMSHEREANNEMKSNLSYTLIWAQICGNDTK